jgi:hypothetical protein
MYSVYSYANEASILLVVCMSCCQAVVLSDKPLISEDTEDLEPSLLEELLRNIAMLASVYHKVCCVRRIADQHDATVLLLATSTSFST